MVQKIIMGAQSKIDQYYEISVDFFENVLKMDRESVLITDASQLSDFMGCGLDDDVNFNERMTYIQMYDYWYSWVTVEIVEKYGFAVPTPRINLGRLFERISNEQNDRNIQGQ